MALDPSSLTLAQITVEQTLPLRHEVLWPDLPIEKVKLSEDSNGWHFGALMDGTESAVAVISLFLEPLPSHAHEIPPENNMGTAAARFRKFACKSNMQGRGIGTRLLDHTLHFARTELGASTVWCDARTSTSQWYEKRGFTPFGNKFYKGSVEYICMKISFSATEVPSVGGKI
ncbi:hypothetical protein VKT23_011991 [Stygiomarasmius scandens]|uniref:N-acetyltransferase domain-containing protein n=1 Tax=Marasmiellus scandens TaxID=2682957 RepID=A0ABR1J8H6_9AGAR